MEPPGGIPPDRDKISIVQQQPPQHQPNVNPPILFTTFTTPPAATAPINSVPTTAITSITSSQSSSSTAAAAGTAATVLTTAGIITTTMPHQQQSSMTSGAVSSSTGSGSQQQTNLERLSRPMAFDKMEGLVREMQDPENGVPVRQQKMFLTSIPYAFMGYDLIEWLMDRLSIEESEALNIANQLCLHGYFFPVNDTKTLVVKDDSSLYRFQTPYYWPWQHKAPDNVEYAIYLAKRSLRNKQRHGLEDYESDALSSLHKNLKGKWDFISMQAEEQVRLAKERKKGDKIVSDSQERAYWRVHRPPLGQFTPLEPCPVPSRDRQGIKPKKKTIDDWQREVDYLNKSLNRTRMKMSQACESLVTYWETFSDYDFFIQPVLPSNPWVSEDITFWQLNNSIVEIPTEKRVKRWSISIEELVSDPTGLQEFTHFLEKEYSHENIRFWIAVNKLRRSAHSQVSKKVNEIYEEFLKPGAPCEINIDGKTMEIVQKGLKNPTRFTFDAAAEHIYMLLLKKDCYPRFVRSEHFKMLLASGIQPSHKKRFFNFGGVAKKKTSTVQQPSQNQGLMAQTTSTSICSVVVPAPPAPGHLARRRGSDRSLSGSAHELAVISNKDPTNKVPHSHSQSNLSEIPYSVTVYRGDMPNETSESIVNKDIKNRKDPGIMNNPTIKGTQDCGGGPKSIAERLEPTAELSTTNAVCPWEIDEPVDTSTSTVQLSVCPWEETEPPKKEPILPLKLKGITPDITEVSERMKRSCGLRQNTVDSDYSTKRLMPAHNEQRRSSMTITPRVSEFQLGSLNEITLRPSTTPSPTTFRHHKAGPEFPSSSSICESNKDQSTTSQLPAISTISMEIVSTSTDSSEKKDEDTCKEIGDLIKDDHKSSKTTLLITSPIPSVKIPYDKCSIEKCSTPTIHVVCPVSECDTSEVDDEMEQIHLAKQKMELKLKIAGEDGVLSTTQHDDALLFEKPDDEHFGQEELSPTMEEYQEGTEFVGEQADVYEYDISDDDPNVTPVGCVAPAPTPAPSLAPLAEIEMDAVDDESDARASTFDPATDVEETKKKRKKRGSDAKKLDDKSDNLTKGEESNRNAVCPWEDE